MGRSAVGWNPMVIEDAITWLKAQGIEVKFKNRINFIEATVILNPYAGRWRALKRKPELETALKWQISIMSY
jgi:hypothetical protein